MRLSAELEEVQDVPEAIDYINKFGIMKAFETGPAYSEIDSLPYQEYQLLIVMSNAYGNRIRHQNAQYTSRQAMELEMDN